jgi:predicted amidohydrolase
MRNLKIAPIQCDLKWEDPKTNLLHIEALVDRVDPETDLIVLPEMFSTGFSMRAHTLAQKMSGQTVKWLKRLSCKKKIDITGSVMICENNRYFNRLLWATPNKDLFTYDKKHLFRYAGEEKIYTPGNSHLTVTLKGWNIRPFICYDLRFPIWTRNYDNQYDLALFVANWPRQRANHWQLLLQARAIENQCFVAGVNRLGCDGNQITYNGGSIIVKPDGIILFNADEHESTQSVALVAEQLKLYRQTFPVWMDADTDMVKLNSNKCRD